jgi:sulfate/thiosulfate-binding protein
MLPRSRCIFSVLLFALSCTPAADIQLLNVSYDPTRELYRDANRQFTEIWKEKSGKTVRVDQSHGGSGKQARSVIDGLNADVVTLALSYDVDAIAEKGLIARDWARRLPNNSVPFYSTIVFLVRKGNPKQIQDWSDLARPGIGIITPNPKTSGGARWNYLAARAYSMERGDDQAKTREFMKKLLANVLVLDAGARASATTFARNGQGDVLLSWESEAFLLEKQFKNRGLEIVYPGVSIRADTPVAVVDQVVDRRGTREAAEAYLKFLFTEEAQKLASAHGYRPAMEGAKSDLRAMKLIGIERFGGWARAHADYFADGAEFDQLNTRTAPAAR